MSYMSVPPTSDQMRMHTVFISSDIPRHSLPNHLRIKEAQTPKKAETLFNRIMEVRREEFQREQNTKKEDALREEETRKKLLALVESRDIRFQEEKENMYPISEELKKILYTGVSMTGEGRYLYLKIRNRMAPEEKFRRIVTETQVYGWKVEERSERPLKEHNRLSIIQDSFYRRFGAIKPESMRKNPPFTKAQISMDVL